MSAHPGIPHEPAPADSPSTAKPLGVLALSFLILFIDGYDLFTLGTVGPALLQHGAWDGEITAGTLGMLGSVTGIGMIVGSAVAGRAGDRWGFRLPLGMSLALISAAMLMSALAPTLAVFVTARLLTGLGVGALAPLVGSLVAAHAPHGRRALYIAVAMAAIGLGGATSAFLGRALLPGTEFQWLFVPGAMPLLLVPLLVRFIPHDRVGSKTGHHDAGRVYRPKALLDSERRRVTLLLWTASFMSIALIYSTSNWLPSVMLKAGYDLNSALEFSTAFTVGASVGTTALSLLADRGHLRTVTLGGVPPGSLRPPGVEHPSATSGAPAAVGTGGSRLPGHPKSGGGLYGGALPVTTDEHGHGLRSCGGTVRRHRRPELPRGRHHVGGLTESGFLRLHRAGRVRRGSGCHPSEAAEGEAGTAPALPCRRSALTG
ncbi:MFS transporter [Streptomyces sp. NPDC048438]|uniref:MFS transporter n=1 Tax=Streptomyces sp. NPDC048438 TaxID=3365551 RepID=UPI0037147B5F